MTNADALDDTNKLIGILERIAENLPDTPESVFAEIRSLEKHRRKILKQIEIQARLDACPIPVDAVADWNDSEHWEITDSPVGNEPYFWLVLSELIPAAGTIVPSNTPDGKRLGAVFDYACAYRRDVGYLLGLIRERGGPQ